MTLPEDFTAYTKALMGEDLFATLQRGLDEEAPSSIRFNPFKMPEGCDVAAALVECGEAEGVAWCPDGVYLKRRAHFTFDPLFHAGLYYVQEASSMFVSHIVRQLVHSEVVALDLCAAPGGKTTAVRAALPSGSILFANEPMKLRASILAENVQKFGHPDVVVTNNFPKDYRRSGLAFDLIIADVPCSGEGMFRKDEGSIGEWSMQNVEKCRLLQRSIVEDVWPCLNDGGLLIYSTCTFNAHENEENVCHIAETLGADFVEVPTLADWQITGALVGNEPVYRFIPGKTRGEGLFVAVLRKHGACVSGMGLHDTKGTKAANRQRVGRGGAAKMPNGNDWARQWLKGDYVVSSRHEVLRAIPERWHVLYEKAAKSLHVLHAGVTLGTAKGTSVIPDASLALSTDVAVGAFPRVEADYESAIGYLHKEAIVLPPDAPRGIVLVCYKGHPLGFAKNIGNRANNLYPHEWRIKSSHLPEKVMDLVPI